MNDITRSVLSFISGPLVTCMRSAIYDERVRYFAAGGVTAVVFFGLFSAAWLTLRGSVPYPMLGIGAQGVTIAVVYPLYRLMVFRSTGSWVSGMLRFYLTCASGVVLSATFLLFFAEVLKLPVLLAQMVSLPLISVIIYPVQRYWTFRSRARGGAGQGRDRRIEQPEESVDRFASSVRPR